MGLIPLDLSVPKNPYKARLVSPIWGYVLWLYQKYPQTLPIKSDTPKKIIYLRKFDELFHKKPNNNIETRAYGKLF